MPTVHTRRTRLSLYLTASGLTATLPSGETVHGLTVDALLDLVNQWAGQVVTDRAELTLHGRVKRGPARGYRPRQRPRAGSR